LAEGITQLAENLKLRQEVIAMGFEMFRSLYNCEVYAQSIAKMLGIERH